MTTTESGFTESQAATGSELAALAPALSFEKLPDQVAHDLYAVILNYKEAKDASGHAPGPDMIDSDLARLNESATGLGDIIANLQPADLGRLAAADRSATKDLATVVEKMGPQLAGIAKASERALQALRQGPGAPPSDTAPLQKLILSLMVIFEKETGKEAGNSWDPRKNVYFGPFFDLVKGVSEIADPEAALGNSALGSQITKALMKAKDLSREYFARILARSSRKKDTAAQPGS